VLSSQQDFTKRELSQTQSGGLKFELYEPFLHEEEVKFLRKAYFKAGEASYCLNLVSDRGD
jgi:hypothetical protein